MPKHWLYYIALCMPLVFRVLILNTGFVNWLWYNNYPNAYYFFSALAVNPSFLTFVGGWALPVFVFTIISFWVMEMAHGDDHIEHHFILLPVMYVPFSIVGDFLVTLQFNPMNLFAHPVIIIPFGYLYIGMWEVFIRVMSRLNLVME